METAFAKETLRQWLNSNRDSLTQYINTVDVDAPTGRAASIQLDTPSHTIGITAWDHQNKLEIITIDTATGGSRVEDKAYTSSDRLLARLNAFLAQLSQLGE